MLEQLFPKYHRRYAASPHVNELRAFARWLTEIGYGRDPAHDHVRRLREALDLRGRRLEARIDRTGVDDLFARLPDIAPYSATRRAFVRCLDAHGRLVAEPDRRLHAATLVLYEDQLRNVRGLGESTVAQHLATVQAFLAEVLPDGSPISALTRELVEQHLVTTGRRITRQSMQHCVARLRSFLRFCHSNSLLAQPLDAIDTPRVYRDELPPRALPWRIVTGLLRSIDRSTATGWRDYTILHLMSHYGLRPSEIVSLRLDAIDWEARTLRVAQCKTRSVLTLPMDDRTLRIIKRYLFEGRPGSDLAELFLRARGPAGPMKHYAVCNIYQMRAARSGLDLQGTSAYSLRHSFAMRLLDRGVGVKAIGDVLGHRGLESTCVYLRLQLDALRDVALPLPKLAVATTAKGAQ
ncbi:MAG: integrase [Variovorax paradoxus]|nr:MAG: integrase [Variovorax paradoxus]PZQ05229.1 MAG: integrase [Variovorax paradoxus]